MRMKDYGHFKTIESDLALDVPFVKGQKVSVKRCWHFSTDGNAVDVMFYDETDFRDGMNRIYVVLRKYNIIILAFVLMDTHVHFLLYGDFDECNRFMHDYVARTSRHIRVRHGDARKMDGVSIDYQVVDNKKYLKTVICYIIKNPPVAGIPFMSWTYPWSSGPLYFNRGYSWTMVPVSTVSAGIQMTDQTWRASLKTRTRSEPVVTMVDGLVYPGEYVASDLVERIFRTSKSFHFFLCHSKEDEVDSRGGKISHLSVPMQEMRQHKTEHCQAMFGTGSIKYLSMEQRLRLARLLHHRYNSSIKQIARLCGLVYSEVKDMI